MTVRQPSAVASPGSRSSFSSAVSASATAPRAGASCRSNAAADAAKCVHRGAPSPPPSASSRGSRCSRSSDLAPSRIARANSNCVLKV